MLGFIYALFSAISFSTNNIFLKKTSQKVNVHTAMLLVYFFTTIISFIILILFDQIFKNLNPLTILTIFFTGIVGAVAIFSLIKGFTKMNIAKTLAIANFYPFITLVLFVIFYSEKISFFNFISMIIVFLGIVLTLDGNIKFKFDKNLLFPITTAIGWGIYFFFLTLLSRFGLDNFNVLFFSEAAIFLSFGIYVLTSSKIKVEVSKINIKISFSAFFAGLFATLGVLLFVFAIKKINGPIAGSIVSSQVLWSSLFAFIFFKERLKLIQIVGIILVFIGLISFQIL